MMFRFDKKQLGAAESVAHSTVLPVRFQDVDAAGIVFFARMFDYVHAAYEEFLAAAGHPLPSVLKDKRWAAPLRHAEADYLAPARFGDSLVVELVAAHLEESEISLGWRIRAESGSGKPTALLQTVHTFVSAENFQRTRVPDEIIRKLSSVELAAG